jgi:hypothetical protein
MYMVCGGSSVGKSTFIKSREANKLIPNLNLMRIGMFYEIKNPKEIEFDVLHYNILREADKNFDKYNYEFENIFIDILNENHIDHVYILIAPLSLIKRRIVRRMYVEEHFSNYEKYQSENWLNLYTRLNIKKIYFDFIKLVKVLEVPYSVLNAENSLYRSINDDVEIEKILES